VARHGVSGRHDHVAAVVDRLVAAQRLAGGDDDISAVAAVRRVRRVAVASLDRHVAALELGVRRVTSHDQHVAAVVEVARADRKRDVAAVAVRRVARHQGEVTAAAVRRVARGQAHAARHARSTCVCRRNRHCTTRGGRSCSRCYRDISSLGVV